MRTAAGCASNSASASTVHSRIFVAQRTRPWSAWRHSAGCWINWKGRRVSRLWNVRKAGSVLGPFPTGAIVADRLVGRISPLDELSPDGEEWRAFDAWPELTAAL